MKSVWTLANVRDLQTAPPEITGDTALVSLTTLVTHTELLALRVSYAKFMGGNNFPLQ